MKWNLKCSLNAGSKFQMLPLYAGGFVCVLMWPYWTCVLVLRLCRFVLYAVVVLDALCCAYSASFCSSPCIIFVSATRTLYCNATIPFQFVLHDIMIWIFRYLDMWIAFSFFINGCSNGLMGLLG